MLEPPGKKGGSYLTLNHLLLLTKGLKQLSANEEPTKYKKEQQMHTVHHCTQNDRKYSAVLELPLHTSSTSSAAPSPVVWVPKVHNSSMVNDDDMVMVHGIFVPFLKQQNKVKLTTYPTFQWDFGGSLFHQRLVSRNWYLEPKKPLGALS